MTAPIKTEIAVIGAGVIGLALAHRLRAKGREVVVIDPNDPGSAASYGNAGTIADYAVMPVGTPDVPAVIAV
jgi:D-hydroxyproline dehydrogenase